MNNEWIIPERGDLIIVDTYVYVIIRFYSTEEQGKLVVIALNAPCILDNITPFRTTFEPSIDELLKYE